MPNEVSTGPIASERNNKLAWHEARRRLTHVMLPSYIFASWHMARGSWGEENHVCSLCTHTRLGSKLATKKLTLYCRSNVPPSTIWDSGRRKVRGTRWNGVRTSSFSCNGEREQLHMRPATRASHRSLQTFLSCAARCSSLANSGGLPSIPTSHTLLRKQNAQPS